MKYFAAVFLGYKILLITILSIIPNLEFDSSSKFLFGHQLSTTLSVFTRAIERLAIWDSVYFVSIAKRGVLYENEYAFANLWPRLIRVGAWPLLSLSNSPEFVFATVSIVMANTCHYFACRAIRNLATVVIPNRNQHFYDTISLLFVISPGAFFLTAGYSEALFALLSFQGLYRLYTGDVVLSGILFALSTLVRSNGLLWGILMAYEGLNEILNYFQKVSADTEFFSRPELCVEGAVPLLEERALKEKFLRVQLLKRVVAFGANCVLILSAFIFFQYFAYLELCPGRDFCDSAIPLVYPYVQAKYWNNGFLRYWTPNNIPNFLFACPTLIIITRSFPYLWRRYSSMRGVLLVQAALFVGAIFFWHVQIITRVATCLPTVYIYVADLLSTHKPEGRYYVEYFLLWAALQAVLFAVYLPPA